MPLLEQIKASAGSGKTYTLTRRFLSLLRDALPAGDTSLCALLPDSAGARRGGQAAEYSLAGILATTFTNKAAAEMQARIIRELKQQALRANEAHSPGNDDFPLTPAEAMRWMDSILRRFDSMNIRTIDSLLTLLVRLNALSLSLPPDFSPVFSLEETLLPLYDELLDKAASGDTAIESLLREACRGLLRLGGASSLFVKDAIRTQLEKIIRLHLEGKELPRKEDTDVIVGILTTMAHDVAESAAALARLAEDASCSFSANAGKFLARCAQVQPLVLPAFSDTFAGKDLQSWLLKASGARITQDMEKAHADLVTAYATLKRDGKMLLTTLKLMPLIILARPLLDALDTLQREEGLVPATRICSLALASLRSGHGVSDAFCRLGERLTHILFDEFQDTSTDQWHSVLPLAAESLARGGSLTYVGDVKQAIYGWRGGNADLFDSVAADATLAVMLEDGPISTSLPHNWRSAPTVVAFNNAMFGQLAEPAFAKAVVEAMTPKAPAAVVDEAALSLASAFAASEQLVPEKNAARDGYVRLRRLPAGNKTAVREAVQEELHELVVNNLLTRHSPGDIAILVRKNDEAGHIAEWLTAWHVPVVTEQSFRLGAHPLITRLVDMLTFLEFPLNDAAFWSAVSGPEIFPAAALDFPGPDALTEWLANARERSSSPLYTLFRADYPALWNRIVAPFFDQAGLLSAYDMVRELINRFALATRYPSQAPFLRRFAEIAHAAEDAGHSSLSAFLDFWAETGNAERVPMPENMDAVRILTMHKAKGLEFPVVIVPYLHDSGKNSQPLTSISAFGLTLLTERPSDSIEAVRAVTEQLNLLYVAWTRPTEELHAFITGKPTNAGLAGALGVMLHSLPFTEDVFAVGVPPQGFAQKAKPEPELSANKIELERCNKPETEESAPLMAWLPRLKIFRHPTDEAGFSERQRGLLAHACLESLRLTGDTANDMARAVRQGLRAFPVPVPDPEAVHRELNEMLAWYASLPDTALWMRHGTPEQPLMDEAGAMHRVDLLVDAPGTPLLAVEYKTGNPGPEHLAQVSRYLELLCAHLKRTDTARGAAGVIVYLDLRRLVPVTARADTAKDGEKAS